MSSTDYGVPARRRALNIIWTAAGEYGFEPAFMAFTQDGQPDLYMDSIIGYVRKWYDRETMQKLFDTTGSSLMRETFDGILWIGLENCAFEREVRERPVLSELRHACAEMFFEQQFTKSRQQWMAQNSLVYALQSARWNTVLGKEPGLVNPWEKNLFQELAFSGDWDARQIADHAYSVLRRYFRFSPGQAEHSLLLLLKNRLFSFPTRILPSRMMRAEDLTFSRDGSGNGIITARKSRNAGLLTAAEEENNRIYIQNCFGLPLYNTEESSRIEQLLCSGRHQGCHIYFTDGLRQAEESIDVQTGKEPKNPASDGQIRETIRGAQAQAERNRTHYKERLHFYENCIARLSQQIRNALLVYPQPSRVAGRNGRIAPEKIWRAVYLNDERIFTEKFEEEQPDFSVDLMLDAAASRLQSQETIAAQAYVIARSLHLCRIPVQVTSFLSLRGYTVIRRFCGYDEMDKDERIFDYFAAGWNRDGLALRGAGQLMQDFPAKNSLLIILTDASPNDDRKIPPDRAGGHPLSRDYSGEAGIRDTSSEVRALKKSGVQVMAVLNGEDGSSEAARRIYGDDFVRIENIRRLSDAVGTLLQKKIERFF